MDQNTVSQRQTRATQPTTEGSVAQLTQRRVESFLAANPQQRWTANDDVGTLYGCFGLVLLASAISDSRNARELASISGFLEEFTATVILIMDVSESWNGEAFRELVHTARDGGADPDKLSRCFEDTLERCWGSPWHPDLCVLLEIGRAKRVWGGAIQPCVDHAYAAELVPHVPDLLHDGLTPLM